MRIGILGGTFDPPHRAHLALAEAALEQLELDELMFLPARQNPLKKDKSVASAIQRMEMVQILAKKNLKFSVCDFEIQKGGSSYTVETLDALTYAQPADYWFIMGADALKSLPSWRQPDRLAKLCRFAVASRPNINETFTTFGMPEWIQEKIDHLEVTEDPVSSTQVRHALQEGRNVTPLVDAEVLQYIRKNKLYGVE